MKLEQTISKQNYKPKQKQNKNKDKTNYQYAVFYAFRYLFRMFTRLLHYPYYKLNRNGFWIHISLQSLHFLTLVKHFSSKEFCFYLALFLYVLFSSFFYSYSCLFVLLFWWNLFSQLSFKRVLSPRTKGVLWIVAFFFKHIYKYAET